MRGSSALLLLLESIYDIHAETVASTVQKSTINDTPSPILEIFY